MKERLSEASPVEARPAYVRAARRGATGASSPLLVLDGIVRSAPTALTFLGLTLGVFISRKFFVLPIAVLAAAAQERIKGVRHGRRPVRTGRR